MSMVPGSISWIRINELLTTVWPGKSDLYHATQATLIPYYAPDLSIAPAVKWEKPANLPDRK